MNEDILKNIKPGATVRVWEKIKEGPSTPRPSSGQASSGQAKTRLSKFEGIVLARKHGSEPGATFTVRATVAGEGVEKIYPIHSPLIEKVEILSAPRKVRRAKLYYLRRLSKKEIRQKIEA